MIVIFTLIIINIIITRTEKGYWNHRVILEIHSARINFRSRAYLKAFRLSVVQRTEVNPKLHLSQSLV